eukprot:1377554-Pleurochrysis_carterae.AAC.1
MIAFAQGHVAPEAAIAVHKMRFARPACHSCVKVGKLASRRQERECAPHWVGMQVAVVEADHGSICGCDTPGVEGSIGAFCLGRVELGRRQRELRAQACRRSHAREVGAGAARGRQRTF